MIALLLLLQSPAPVTGRAVETWRVRVASPDSTSIVGEHHGSPFVPEGAILSLHSVRTPPPGSWATLTGVIPADSLRNHLVTITADVSTVNAPEGAALWMRVDGQSGSMAFRNTSSDEPVTGTASRALSITLRANSRAVSILFGLILTGSGQAEAQHVRIVSKPSSADTSVPAVRQLLDSVYSAVRHGAYWRDTVTWSVVEPDFWAIAEGARTTDEAYPAIRWLLPRLGDHHSHVTTPDYVKQISAPASPAAGDPNASSPEVRSLGAGIGYVMVPAFGNIDSSMGVRFANTLHSGLARVGPAQGCGWVVDLRPNGGGNMWPMLAGLQPFLGSGTLGYFQDPSRKNGPPWRAGLGYDKPPASLRPLGTAPVAVLIGPRTASSGEAVAIAFSGRPRTRSFGLPTVGLANANSPVPLPDGGMLLLMTAVDVDRDGKVYGYKVDPNVIVPDGGPGTDRALEMASTWLRSESRCK